MNIKDAAEYLTGHNTEKIEIGQSGAEVYDIEGQYLLKRVREVYFSRAEGYERLKAGSIAG